MLHSLSLIVTLSSQPSGDRASQCHLTGHVKIEILSFSRRTNFMLEDTTVIFRYYYGELPYIKAFLNHYIELGAHQLIGIVQSDQDENDLKKIFSSCDGNHQTALRIYNMPTGLSTNKCLRKIQPADIPEAGKWTLNVDSDEFIILKKQSVSGSSAGEVRLFSDLIPNIYDRINLKWVMSANSSSISSRGTQWNIGKDMALTQHILSLPDVHTFTTSNPTQKSPTHKFEINFPLCIAHHWGRTIEDTLIKIGYQKEKLNNPKNNDFNSIDEFLKTDELPTRLRFMAFLDSLPKDIDITASNHQQFYDLEAQEMLVSKIATKKQLAKIKDLYNEYVQRAVENYDNIFCQFVRKTVNDSCRKIPSLAALRTAKAAF